MGIYSHVWVNLPVSYTNYYFPFGRIDWSSDNNPWWTGSQTMLQSATGDIMGYTGYSNKTMSGFI